MRTYFYLTARVLRCFEQGGFDECEPKVWDDFNEFRFLMRGAGIPDIFA